MSFCGNSYGLDINMERVEDVLLHHRLLTEAKDPESRPVFYVRLVEVVLLATLCLSLHFLFDISILGFPVFIGDSQYFLWHSQDSLVNKGRSFRT